MYSAALRQVESADLAADIAQKVFVDLARKAGSVAERLAVEASLAGWLHRATRYAALKHLRDDRRRLANERQAMNQFLSNAGPSADWEQIRPALDEALDSLGEEDREALLLRFFRNQDFRAVGRALGVSDDAAQKRVSRAVERLREFLSKRNVTIGASGLAVLISANAVQSAPVGLAATISTTVALTTTTLGMTMIHKILIAGFAVAAIGSGIYSIQLQKQIGALQQQQTSLNQQIAQLQTDNESYSNRLAQVGDAKKLSEDQFDELLKLRGETGVLRRQLDELAEKNRPLQTSSHLRFSPDTNSSIPQIHIKARFLTMPKDVSAGWYDSTSAGILTDENFRIALKQLRSRNDVETLAEPEVVLTSGRQVQMRATQIISVVTNFCLQETNGTSSIVPQTENVETGPVLDAIPRVLPDSYTIELPVIASVVEFLGYAQSTNTTPAYNSAGQEIDVPTVSPQFRVQSTTNSVNLFDDQTLVFGLKDNQVQTDAALAELDGSKTNSLNRHTLVFVTATIIDPAGNRVHEDASYTNIPPQAAEQ
ncbi:MAG TPA: sigma-70 family RNA polymerase sigma factor [Verrucomicrobiae bacterium]|nr:sigma-70 family RNA polymerase sigma factor [Verrucomicrobiae bacterium]